MPQLERIIRRVISSLRGLRGFLGLLAILLMAVLLSPRARDGSLIFTQVDNITDILRQVSEIGIMAVGMTFVILTAGIDLSVGSVLALSASLTAKLLTSWQPPLADTAHIALVVCAVLIATSAVGVVNGVVVSRLRIQPFIVTLASMIGIRGLARWLTGNTNIDMGFGEDVTSVFATCFSNKALVIVVFLAVAGVFGFLLSRTVFGRYVRALGDNPQAARYAGLPVRRIQVAVYTLAGLLSGLAGVIHCAQNHQGSPNAGFTYELEAIAAVVIGGTSLAGGRGTIVGTIVGTLIMGVLTNILRLNNVDANVEMMLKAVIIIAAVRLQRTSSKS